MSKLPPLNLLRTFEAAARLSSMTGASRELNVTHAAVSQQIKQLESWFGRKLFDRAGRGVVLTPAGTEFRDAVAAALLIITTSAKGLRLRHDRKSLLVACIPSIASRWLVPELQSFMEQHTAIDVRVEYAHAMQTFDPGLHDVLITWTAQNLERFHSVQLFSRINKPVASAYYVERHPEILLAGGLERANLLHDESMQAWADWFQLVGRRRLVSPRGPVYQDFNLLASAVIAGHGVALCPIEVFRREITRGDLVVLSDTATLEDQGYFLISEKSSSRPVDAFIRWFAEVCQSDFEPAR